MLGNRLQNVSKTEVDSCGLRRIGEHVLSVANTSSVSRLGTKTARHHQLREMRLNGFESLPQQICPQYSLDSPRRSARVRSLAANSGLRSSGDGCSGSM